MNITVKPTSRWQTALISLTVLVGFIAASTTVVEARSHPGQTTDFEVTATVGDYPPDTSMQTNIFSVTGVTCDGTDPDAGYYLEFAYDGSEGVYSAGAQLCSEGVIYNFTLAGVRSAVNGMSAELPNRMDTTLTGWLVSLDGTKVSNTFTVTMDPPNCGTLYGTGADWQSDYPTCTCPTGYEGTGETGCTTPEPGGGGPTDPGTAITEAQARELLHEYAVKGAALLLASFVAFWAIWAIRWVAR